MKVFSEQDFNALPRGSDGFKHCPTGDYSQIKVFGKWCSFGEGCSFGKWCSFGEGCSFGKRCSFGDGCSFGKRCSFGEGCSFGKRCSFGEGCSFGKWCSFGEGCSFGWLPSPTMVLLWDWGNVSDGLTIDLMRYDASLQPDSARFDDWAKGKACPLQVGRAAQFEEKRELWSPGPAKTALELVRLLFKEKGLKTSIFK